MRSQLLTADITNIGGSTWSAEYAWHKDGNIASRTINSTPKSFQFNGDLMTDAGSDELCHDLNGNMTTTYDADLAYTWNNRMQSADSGTDTVDLKYDFDGNRIYREVDNGTTVTKRKYILDITTSPPVVLLELDPDNSNSIEQSYVYAEIEILVQYDGDQSGQSTNKYFYLHDRNTNVRLVLDDTGDVVNRYTYQPFGEDLTAETTENIANVFKYIGGWFDKELDQYHFGAREYKPSLGIFTARDSVRGAFENPLSLHRYLYSLNDPINLIDPTGEVAVLGLLGGMAKWAGLAASMYGAAEIGWNMGAALTGRIAVRDLGMQLLIDGAMTATGAGVFNLGGKLLKMAAGLNKGRKAAKALPPPRQLKALPPVKIHQHHIFVQKHRDWFLEKGIKIDDFTVDLSQQVHQRGVHGRGGFVGPGNVKFPRDDWTKRWDDFIADNQDADALEIFQFGGELMDEYGLSHLPLKEYIK